MLRRCLHASARATLAPPRVPLRANGPASGAGTGLGRNRRVRKGRVARKAEPVAARIPALASVIRHGLRDVDAVVGESGDTISIDPGGSGGSSGSGRDGGKGVDGSEAPTFFLHPAPEDPTKLYFTSGGAQSWRYEWDLSEGCFKAEDGHDLLGMVSRELLWFTTGLPKF